MTVTEWVKFNETYDLYHCGNWILKLIKEKEPSNGLVMWDLASFLPLGPFGYFRNLSKIL